MKKIIFAAFIVATFFGGFLTSNMLSGINEAGAITYEHMCDEGIKFIKCRALGNWSKYRLIEIQIPPGHIDSVSQTATDKAEIIYTPE